MSNQLIKEQIQIVNQNLDDDGKLSCMKSFKVAKLLNVKLEDMMIVAVKIPAVAGLNGFCGVILMTGVSKKCIQRSINVG